MARPTKQGLDYFPLDVDIDQDDKVLLVEALHGIQGFGMLIKLLMRIYKEGYYYKWTEIEQILFSKRVNVDINVVKEVVNDCIKYGVFDNNLFEQHHILTSKGIQKRYFEASTRRKNLEIEDKFLLISADKLVNVNKNSINANKNSESTRDNVVNNGESKVKESKVNKTKETIPFKKVIDYLNEKADKNFKHTAAANKKVISARFNEGYTLEDFYLVVDYCCKEWKGKTFSNGKLGDEYLQPSTLFNNKFDERLNKAKSNLKKNESMEQPNYETMTFEERVNLGEDV